jgi:5-methylcytosine-specific restriction endonuclease McrA
LIDAATHALVIARAGNRCEYCALPQSGYAAPFNIDHVIASQHRHDDAPENLAWACPKCNQKKGPNLSGLDPATGSIVPLFHPRSDRWANHFR